VRDLEGHYYAMSVRPYRTSDNRIDGVLIALVDTDAMKRSLEEIRRARDYARRHCGDGAGAAGGP